jgi:hypothetical protein
MRASARVELHSKSRQLTPFDQPVPIAFMPAFRAKRAAKWRAGSLWRRQYVISFAVNSA